MASDAPATARSAMQPTSHRPVLLYDDTCAFCRRGVRRLVRLSGNRVDAQPSRLVLGPDANPGEIKLLMPDARMLGGADGILLALAQAPLWRPLVWVAMLPGIRVLPRTAYRWIARRRHRLGRVCTTETCPADGQT